MPNLVSLVIPVYNEGETLPYLRNALTEWKTSLAYGLEVVLVDDGSTDNSFWLLCDWADSDPDIRVISLSRNFGHQAAVTAGFSFARGDAIVIIDADLQDPLDVIPMMVEKYREGYDVVYGRRTCREGEGLFKRFTAWLFYRVMRFLVHRQLPEDVGDFRLVSRRCMDVVLRMGEVHRFLRGMFAWVGFEQTAVEYRRAARLHGQTKYPFSKMARLALDAAISFSTVPIKLIGWAGLATAAFGFGYAVYSVLQALVFHDTVRGWTTLVVLFALVGGMILVALSVIGEYVARIYEQVKGRPLYVVKDTRNVDMNGG
jgi:dolichol-phosphate mannosyltransferase